MIIISPYSRQLRNGVKPNPKDYPWWNRLIELIRVAYPQQNIIQIGVSGEEPLNDVNILFNQKLDDLKILLKECDFWISVDNFFHHFAAYHGKKGIVLFGQSDPIIFGWESNINLLKDRSFLRKDQFDFWENTKHNRKSFVNPEKVMSIIKQNFS